MAEDSDGIEEAFEGQVRVLLTAAGQVGERIARAREDALRRAQAQSEQQARELRSRFEAEHRTARVELGNVYRADWWDRATPEQIGRAYEVARAWSHEDPEAVRAEQRIVDELRTRFGMEPGQLQAQIDETRRAQAQDVAREAAAREAQRNELTAAQEWAREHDPEALRTYEQGVMGTDRVADEKPIRDRLVQRYREATGAVSDVEVSGRRDPAARERESAERAEAALLMAQADRDERAAEQARAAADHEPDPTERSEAREVVERHQAAADSARTGAAPLYDSAERREGTARGMEARGVAPAQVATVMRADVSQAKPATEAAKSTATRAPKARRSSRGRGAQVQRTGLDR